MRDERRGNVAARTCAVFYNHILVQALADALRDHPRHCVRETSGRKGNEDRDPVCRIGLRRCAFRAGQNG
jgi:hypothetical protein